MAEPIPPLVFDWLMLQNPDFARWIQQWRASISDIIVSTSASGRLAFFNADEELISKDLIDLVAVSGSLLAVDDDGSGGVTITGTLADMVTFIAGSSGRITVSDDGDGTVTLTVPLKAGYGIDSDSDGLKLKQQAHEADATTTHAITDPTDSPADADALREDLVTNTIPSIESALNALGTKYNNLLAKLETAEILASS